jgi:hypothetical protein
VRADDVLACGEYCDAGSEFPANWQKQRDFTVAATANIRTWSREAELSAAFPFPSLQTCPYCSSVYVALETGPVP